MTRKSQPHEPAPANLSPEAMKAGVKKLERRLGELQKFDLESLNPDDPEIGKLENKIELTMVEVFGKGTIEYNQFWISGLYGGGMIMSSDYLGRDIGGEVRAYQEGFGEAIAQLESARDYLNEKLDDLGPVRTGQSKTVEAPVVSGRKVFVVHGHDDEAKLAVARFLEKIDLEPVILHEQTDKGRTVIEKFSDHAGEVGYAVILLTPDDIGGPATEEDIANLKSRARQNVILELGFFVGALGRKNVCALKRGDIEIPSDFEGVIYKPFDKAGAWKLDLAKELQEAGFGVDMNKVV